MSQLHEDETQDAIVHSPGKTRMKTIVSTSELYSFSALVVLCTSKSAKITCRILKIYLIYELFPSILLHHSGWFLQTIFKAARLDEEMVLLAT